MSGREIEFNRDQLRELIKPNIKDFCRRSGCSPQQAYSYVKDNGYFPSIPTLLEICKGFDLDPSIFFRQRLN